MYNRYLPQNVPLAPLEPPPVSVSTSSPPPPPPSGKGENPLNTLWRRLNLTPESGHELSAVLHRFHLEELDTGDLLLALILLLLILEDGDHWDLIITLGLMILFSLSEP